MPDHSSDYLDAAPAPRRRRRAPRTDWRLGGRTVLPWREMLLAVALLSLGAGLLAGFGVQAWWPQAGALATACLWVGMLVPIVLALSWSKPIGLLKLRPVDLLYGVVLGGVLRFVQGALSAAEGDPGFPSFTTIDGAFVDGWWLTDVLAPVLVAPLIEEFFFHGVVLVALYTVLRRPLGALAAGFIAWIVALGLFVFIHAAAGEAGTAAVLSLALLAAVCGVVVLTTGRIWGAVLVHLFYNATFVALALVGTAFA